MWPVALLFFAWGCVWAQTPPKDRFEWFHAVDEKGLRVYTILNGYSLDSNVYLHEEPGRIAAYLGDTEGRRSFAVTLYDDGFHTEKGSPVSQPKQELKFHELPWRSGEQGRSFKYPAICWECKACRGCRSRPELTRSWDGRFLFTSVVRMQYHWTSPPKGATDGDLSFDELVVTPFDLERSEFGPPIVAGCAYHCPVLAGDEPGRFIVVNSGLTGPRKAELSASLYAMNRENKAGGFQNSLQRRSIEVPSDALATPLVDFGRRRLLMVYWDGTIVEVSSKGELRKAGPLEGLSPRQSPRQRARLSGDGKLLFVANDAGAESNELLIYETENFKLLRKLHLQLGMSDPLPNFDGTALYSKFRNLLLKFDSSSLWVKEVFEMENGRVGGFEPIFR